MRIISITLLTTLLASVSCTILPDPIACTAIYAYGITATVTDQDTGSPIPGATLTLTDGVYVEEMESFQTGDFVGAGERAGTYSLTATAPGYQSLAIDDIVVTADICHVHGVHVDVELSPQ
jgi:hypothetical protein